jgi:shikimate kinase
MSLIYLVGFMGAGKTTTGRELASTLHTNFIDLDNWIEQKEGRSIASIFSDKGESHFRMKEEDALSSFTKGDFIISTGGGVILSKRNREILTQNGIVVFLNPDFELIWMRISNDPKRPLATTSSFKKLKERYERRLPLYRSVAHIEVNSSDESTSNQILKEMTLLLNKEKANDDP